MKRFVTIVFAALLAALLPGSAIAQTFCGASGCSAIASASTTRPSNTTTYAANTAWNGPNTSGATYGTLSGACAKAGGQVLIPQLDVYSSANPSTKLQGIVWLFSEPPATVIQDNATFTLAAADFAKLTGNQQGFAFTLTSTQASGAANSGISLTGSIYHARCSASATSMYFQVQVANAYAPASAEVLTVKLHTLGAN